MPRRPLLTAQRFAEFIWFSVTSVRDFRRHVAPTETGAPDYRRRADWTQRHARRLCRIMNWTVETAGSPPAAAIYGANHLGYTDIVMLSASTPVVFVSKSEVKGWPIMGTLAGCAGTLFLQRDRKEDLLTVARQFEPVAAAGVPVVPVVVLGSERLTTVAPWLPFRRGRLALAFGREVAPPARTRSRRADRAEMTERLRLEFLRTHGDLLERGAAPT